MNDAEKLWDNIIGACNEHMPLVHAQTIANKIIAMLPPLETLAALKAGTWKAVPVEPDKNMVWAGGRAIWQHISADADAHENGVHITIWPAGAETEAMIGFKAAISAAPAKPEG